MTTKKNKHPKPVRAWASSTNLRNVYPYGFSCGGTCRFTVPVHIAPVATHATVELAKVRQVMAQFFTTQSTTTERLAIQEALQMLALDKVPRYDPQDVVAKPAKHLTRQQKATRDLLVMLSNPERHPPAKVKARKGKKGTP